jgi:predicted O-methyltransferase YrrM
MSEALFHPEIPKLLESLVPARPPELAAMEAAAARDRFPIIGPAAGQFCYLLTRLLGARSVFELGSGFGYSTAWFARGVLENGGGRVYHTVWDDALSAQARRHLAALGLADVVSFTVGEAVEALERTAGPFDAIFCDIDKAAYPSALPIAKSRLRPGGVLITDNMFWSGDVFDPNDQSPDTRGIREFTRLVSADPDFAVSLVPIRDGLLLARLRD